MAAPMREVALDEVARRTSLDLARTGQWEAAESWLRFHLQAERVDDAWVWPLSFALAPDTASDILPPEVAAFVRRRARAWGATHAGVGVVEREHGERVVTAIFVRRWVETSTVPRALPKPGRVTLWCHPLVAGIDAVDVVVGTPADHFPRFEPRHLDGRFRFDPVLDDGPGRYVIQVVAHTPLGPVVTNQIDVWVGQPPSRVVRISPAPPPLGDAQTIEERIGARLAALRKRKGLPPVRLDAALARVARAHAEDMAARGYFGHRDPTGVGLADRLRRAGLAPRSFAENIAVSSRGLVAWRHWLSSPAHRMHLLDPAMRRFGIGAAIQGEAPWRVVHLSLVLASEP